MVSTIIVSTEMVSNNMVSTNILATKVNSANAVFTDTYFLFNEVTYQLSRYRGSPTYTKITIPRFWPMYVQVGDFCVCRGPSTIALTRSLRNLVPKSAQCRDLLYVDT